MFSLSLHRPGSKHQRPVFFPATIAVRARAMALLLLHWPTPFFHASASYRRQPATGCCQTFFFFFFFLSFDATAIPPGHPCSLWQPGLSKGGVVKGAREGASMWRKAAHPSSIQ